MSRKTAILGGILVALLLAALGERKALLHARVRHQVLTNNVAERVGAVGRDETVASVVDTSSLNSADSQNAIRELPRLRNEVRGLRERSRELPRLRAENDSLQMRLSQASATPGPAEPTPQQGFHMKPAWSHAGLNSPASTVQSFFCALRDGNVSNVIACLVSPSPSGRQRSAPEVMENVRGIGQIKGYRIISSESVGEDTAVVKLQAAVNGITMDMRMRREGTDWKIDFDR